MEFIARTKLLIGDEGINKLKSSTVAIFGIGGVGSFATEALARSGVGNLVLIDYDTINKTNINRQIHSTIKTIGNYKVDAMKNRIEDINPHINVKTYKKPFDNLTKEELLSYDYDYIIDAIDTVPSKISLIINSKNMKIPIVSSMGAGNKIDPTKFKVADIYETNTCPLARIIRNKLKKNNIESLKVVFSVEKPLNIKNDNVNNNIITFNENNKKVIGSVPFVPSVAGLILASVVVRDLIGIPIDYKQKI